MFRLFDGVHTEYKKYDTIQYTCSGTTGNTLYVPNVLNGFGYKSAIIANYNSNTVKNELLNNQRPVLLRGESSSNDGHMWVCDGAHSWYACLPDEVPGMAVGYLYFHSKIYCL